MIANPHPETPMLRIRRAERGANLLHRAQFNRMARSAARVGF
jgi:hypothetical protein